MGFDGFNNAGAASNEYWIEEDIASGVSRGNMQEWPELPLQSVTDNTELELDDSNGMDMTGHGLYWFWDTIWNESQ